MENVHGLPAPSLRTEPYLELLNQTSLQEEKVTRFGQTYNVHIMVKNSPFVVTLGLRNSPQLNFNHLAFDMQLIYDMPGFDKAVTYVSTKPVDFKPAITDKGDEIGFDVKIKVLSSHHEDNFFRLRIDVWDPLEKSNFPSIYIISAPVKVISKPMKPKGARKNDKKKAPAAPAKRKAEAMLSDRDSDEDVQVTVNKALDARLDVLSRQSQQAIDLLNELVSAKRADEGQPAAKRQRTDNMEVDRALVNEDDFDGAFSTMLTAYAAMSAEEKAERTRKLVRRLPQRDLQVLDEMFDILAMVAGRDTSSSVPHFSQFHNENCAEDCPHREELMRMDQFYSEVFFE